MSTHLLENTKAPAFEGLNQFGEKISLKQFMGKKLAIYFYPQDDTPTCTVQGCNLRDNFSTLKDNGIEIIGISPDDVKKHKKFADKFSFPFQLIADVDRIIINAYGVWGPKKLFGISYMGLLRTTFLINEKQQIVKIIHRPKSKKHAEEIIEGFGG